LGDCPVLYRFRPGGRNRGIVVRPFVVVLLALFIVACGDAPAARVQGAVLAQDSSRDLYAVYAPGSRSVRVLLVRPPSIVLLREVFVPADEAVTDVHWTQGALIVETTAERLALDTRTWQLGRPTRATRDSTQHRMTQRAPPLPFG
jgi:hypothetical protein